ncbi:MAG: hypothetical protein GY867_09825 [bacterium]|nr:hypothetical protein [bacterium]
MFRPSGTGEAADHPDDIYWDNSLSPSVAGIGGSVYAATVYNSQLVVGGDFQVAEDSIAYCIASWDGSSWSPLGSGMNDWVWTLTVYDGKLIAGGEFTMAGDRIAGYLAAWTKDENCCLPPSVGDVNQSGNIDITDISVMIDHQFLTLSPLVCNAEGDIDISDAVDITDLSLMIDNQFLTLTPLPPCP